MQIVRVVIVRVIVDGVHGVTIVVLIGHDEVLVIYVAIFVVSGDVLFTLNKLIWIPFGQDVRDLIWIDPD